MPELIPNSSTDGGGIVQPEPSAFTCLLILYKLYCACFCPNEFLIYVISCDATNIQNKYTKNQTKHNKTSHQQVAETASSKQKK